MLEVKHITAAFEVKAMDDEGFFTGYGSVFDNVDSDNEIIARGAFKKTLREWRKRGKLPPVIWQHRFDEPIGPHTRMEEDEKGLITEGHLLVNDVARAREARALIKSGAIGGLSVGFVTRQAREPKKTGPESESGARRVLTELDLFEVSVVTAAANERAMVNEVKSASIDAQAIEQMKSLQELEQALREAGFTRRAATVFVAKCRKQSESVRQDSNLGALVAAISNAT